MQTFLSSVKLLFQSIYALLPPEAMFSASMVSAPIASDSQAPGKPSSPSMLMLRQAAQP